MQKTQLAPKTSISSTKFHLSKPLGLPLWLVWKLHSSFYDVCEGLDCLPLFPSVSRQQRAAVAKAKSCLSERELVWRTETWFLFTKITDKQESWTTAGTGVCLVSLRWQRSNETVCIMFLKHSFCCMWLYRFNVSQRVTETRSSIINQSSFVTNMGHESD